VQQFPFHTTAPEGGSVSITCSSSKPLYGIFLKQTWPQTTNVIYYDGKQPTVDKQFWNRIAFSGSQENLTITMNHLHLANSGVYTCQAVMEDDIWGSGTMVVVTGREHADRLLVPVQGLSILHLLELLLLQASPPPPGTLLDCCPSTSSTAPPCHEPQRL
jgi:hypothetical protein